MKREIVVDKQKITFQFISSAGDSQVVEGTEGDTVMQVAYDNNIDGIAAECGGSMSCGTCHVVLDDSAFERIDAPSQNEIDMLEMVSSERRPTSRLSCQLRLDARFTGAEVHIPESQF